MAVTVSTTAAPAPVAPSPITALLTSMKTVAEADYASVIAPAIAPAVAQIIANPSTAGAVGVTLLATVGVKLGADEISVVASWVHTEVDSLVSKLTSSL